MVSAVECRDLQSIGWALLLRFRLIAAHHRKHPSPAAWDDIDRDYVARLRTDIVILRDWERRFVIASKRC